MWKLTLEAKTGRQFKGVVKYGRGGGLKSQLHEIHISTTHPDSFFAKTPVQGDPTRGVVEHLGCSRAVSPTRAKLIVTVPER